jgi:hypothetical protein
LAGVGHAREGPAGGGHVLPDSAHDIAAGQESGGEQEKDNSLKAPDHELEITFRWRGTSSLTVRM